MLTARTKRSPVFLLFALFLLVLLTTLALGARWGNTAFLNEPLHAAVEALGAMSAVVMAIFLLQGKSEQDIEKYSPLALGFLAMGILDGFHAVSARGHGFILFHSVACLAGGFGAALIWSPRYVNRSIKTDRRLAWKIAGSVIVLGVLTVRYQQWIPAMVENDVFTPAAVTINLAAGVLFIAAFVYFLVDFFRFQKSESYLFSCLYLLFGLAELEFSFSTAWNAQWWFWHLQRLGAYLVVLYFLFHTFHRIAFERNQLLLQLHEALGEVRQLSGLLPICASCKKIRDDKGSWKHIESYLSEHSEAEFSHGLCPECSKRAFAELKQITKK